MSWRQCHFPWQPPNAWACLLIVNLECLIQEKSIFFFPILPKEQSLFKCWNKEILCAYTNICQTHQIWSRSFLTREGLKVFLTAETFSHLEILFAHLEILFGNKVISKFQTFWTGMEVLSDKLPLFAFTETNKVHDLKTNWSSSWSWSSSWIWSRCWQQWITMKPRSDWSSAAPH